MKLGYLLPTREAVMGGRHGAREFVDAARKADDLGYDSVWVGDSLLPRPRHDPLTLLAGRPSRADHVVLRLVGDHDTTLRQIADHRHQLTPG